MNRVEEIKKRLSGLKKLPWKTSGEYSGDYYKPGYDVEAENGWTIAECIDEPEDASFIANSPNDIEYLLSRLEIAEKALEAAKRKFDSDDHQSFDGDNWVRAIEQNEEYKIVTEALQQIRS